jgi:hypothetical protein
MATLINKTIPFLASTISQIIKDIDQLFNSIYFTLEMNGISIFMTIRDDLFHFHFLLIYHNVSDTRERMQLFQSLFSQVL